MSFALKMGQKPTGLFTNVPGSTLSTLKETLTADKHNPLNALFKVENASHLSVESLGALGMLSAHHIAEMARIKCKAEEFEQRPFSEEFNPMIDKASKSWRSVFGDTPNILPAHYLDEDFQGHNGGWAHYTRAEDAVYFTEKILGLPQNRRINVQYHEFRHRAQFKFNATPLRSFSVFGTLISSSTMRLIKRIVRDRYPKMTWKTEMDAAMIGYAAEALFLNFGEESPLFKDLVFVSANSTAFRGLKIKKQPEIPA